MVALVVVLGAPRRRAHRVIASVEPAAPAWLAASLREHGSVGDKFDLLPDVSRYLVLDTSQVEVEALVSSFHRQVQREGRGVCRVAHDGGTVGLRPG